MAELPGTSSSWAPAGTFPAEKAAAPAASAQPLEARSDLGRRRSPREALSQGERQTATCRPRGAAAGPGRFAGSCGWPAVTGEEERSDLPAAARDQKKGRRRGLSAQLRRPKRPGWPADHSRRSLPSARPAWKFRRSPAWGAGAELTSGDSGRGSRARPGAGRAARVLPSRLSSWSPNKMATEAARSRRGLSLPVFLCAGRKTRRRNLDLAQSACAEATLTNQRLAPAGARVRLQSSTQSLEGHPDVPFALLSTEGRKDAHMKLPGRAGGEMGGDD